jgi:rubrerythrin
MTKKKNEIRTWKNLESAFAGESMAYQKYLWFAQIAEKNGDQEIAELFRETAKHETAHAQGHLRNLYPMKLLSSTDLLKIAAEGEKHEYTEMYPSFAKEAKEDSAEQWVIDEFEEGILETKEHSELFQSKLDKIQKVFQGLEKVEAEHYKNYESALNNQEIQFDVSNDYLKNEL